MSALTDSPAWKALAAHQRTIATRHLREWFAAEPGRAARHSFEGAGVFADFSKHRMDDTALDLLHRFALQQDVAGWRDRMFAGEKINTTEGRAALHTALRRPPSMLDGLRITGACLMLYGLTVTEGYLMVLGLTIPEGYLMLGGLTITEGILMGVICSEHTIATYLAAVTKVLCLILLSAGAQGLQSLRAVRVVQGLEILCNLSPPRSFFKTVQFFDAVPW